MKKQKQAFIVGALGGLAAASIKLLANKGWLIYAADIQDHIFQAYKNVNNVVPLQLDIRNEESVIKAFKVISKHTTGLDAVINMAGILKIGSMAELAVSELKEALELNLFGVYRVNQHFLPLVLKNKGRILILSSEVGLQTAAPFNGIYAISKHALEAYADALRRELGLLDIEVIKIQPGPFKTSMTKNAERLFNEAITASNYFKGNLAKGSTYLPKVYKKAHNPELVAKVIFKALTNKKTKTAYLIKPDILRLMLDLLPIKWSDKVIQYFLS